MGTRSTFLLLLPACVSLGLALPATSEAATITASANNDFVTAAVPGDPRRRRDHVAAGVDQRAVRHHRSGQRRPADHTWLWRADHGSGVGWAANIAQNGLVVNGADVTICSSSTSSSTWSP